MCITELDRIPRLSILKAREANFVTLFETAEEVGKGAVQTFERGIHNHGGQIRMRLFTVALVLLVDAQVLARLFVVSNQLFETGIVHLARSHQHAHQRLLLLFCGSHAVLKRSHGESIRDQ